MRLAALLLFAAMALAGVSAARACALFAHGFEDAAAVADDDLCALSDEFEDPATLGQWSRLYQIEGWPDQLEAWDIGLGRPGHMRLLPRSSAWYEDLRGVLVFKPVSGDFVVSTRFHASNRRRDGAPQSLYSLAGLFVRSPRPIVSPLQWTPGGENYVFLSAGSADAPGSYQYEVKTTENSQSVLQISPACSAPCAAVPAFELRAARLEGEHVILLRRDAGGVWQVHRRYRRADLPDDLQVGITAYTDWGSIIGAYWPHDSFGYNSRVLTGGNPDLLAEFDYLRYRRPRIPPALAGRDFSDPAAVSDAELLHVLAE